jgi:hypothetical protein
MSDGIRNMQDVGEELDRIVAWIGAVKMAIVRGSAEEVDPPGFVRPPRTTRCGKCVTDIQGKINIGDIAAALGALHDWVSELKMDAQSVPSRDA